jgi:hypothetical protein
VKSDAEKARREEGGKKEGGIMMDPLPIVFVRFCIVKLRF